MALPQERDGRTQIYVCVTCRKPDEPLEPKEGRSGARLYAMLARRTQALADSVQVIPVECLSVCKRPCTVAFAAPGCWTYVYGDLLPETAPDQILAGAALYAASPEGVIPFKKRPEALRRGVVARIPPLPVPQPTMAALQPEPETTA